MGTGLKSLLRREKVLHLPGDDGGAELKDVAGRPLVAAVDQLQCVDAAHFRIVRIS